MRARVPALRICGLPGTRSQAQAKREPHAKWANKRKIRAFYEMAADLGLTVDHDVPLQGEDVCGLHVENNLTLMSGYKNCSKTNVFKCGPDPLIGHPEMR